MCIDRAETPVVIGTYAKRYGLEENVIAIAKIIKKFDDECNYPVELARLIWKRISKVQHRYFKETVITKELLDDAVSQLEYICTEKGM